MIRIYVILIIIAILAGVGYGGYLYYNDTQARIATLRENNTKLEVAVQSKDAVIKALEDNMAKQIELTKNLNSDLEAARVANTKIKDMLGNTDIIKKAIADPTASEAVINEQIDMFFNAIKSATN